MDEVIVVSFSDDDETISYEIHNEGGEFVSDHETLEDAVREGIELARVHGLPFVKVAV